MADDGILINFDIGSGPVATRPKFKGGSWRDKLAAKKSIQYSRNKNLKLGNGEKLASDAQDHKSSLGQSPRKRLRLDHEQTGDVNGLARATKDIKKFQVRDQAPKQFVSSLFTYNPDSKTVEQEPKNYNDEKIEEPSNAPLQSQLDTFTSLGLTAHVAGYLLKKMDIKAPTAIQRATITQMLKEDTDAFVQAETGSGKTLAYLLPIVQKLIILSTSSGAEQVHRNSGLFAVILAPTRELSRQISVVLDRLLGCAHWLVAGTVIGGEKKKSEKARLRKGLNILIATPGRLADHLDHTEVLDVSNVRWLVLDEGDRLMELGFEKDIETILNKLNASKSRPDRPSNPALPTKRTNILCSATLKMNVQKLGDLSLRDAAHIMTTEKGDPEIDSQKTFAAPAQLQQSFAVVPAKQRLAALTALLKREFFRRGSVMRAIVFISCADSVDFHFEVFSRQQQQSTTDSAPDINATTAPAHRLQTPQNPHIDLHRLHGSLPQHTRTATLARFRTASNPALLLCTDVASRGLDLPNIDLVAEYDPPFHRDDHLHRIGRTARAGNPGRATIFLLPGPEESYAGRVLRPQQGRAAHRVPGEELLRKGFGSKGPGGGRDWEARATEWQLDVERWIQEDARAGEMARRAFQGHVRAYATHVASEREMFDMAALHLGHLAKAFGLRERPGVISVPGLRKVGKGGKEKRVRGLGDVDVDEGSGGRHGAGGEVRDAAKRMREKVKAQTAASEFNLG